MRHIPAVPRLRAGIFLGPFHHPRIDPALALRRDIELVEHLDALGYDEAWFGEHHSSGVETVSSPEIMIAAAAERTSRIKLGTGVISLPYHHPLQVADRIMLLDYLTRGRTMFGAGPGQLLTDARMQGIEPGDQRRMMEESLDVILALFRGETVTCETDWFTVQDACLQLTPYSDFDVAVTASISPSGPRLAGRYGTGMLSVAATDPAGVGVLAEHWQIAEEQAAAHGTSVSRDDWRLVGPMYLAESVDQAARDVKDNLPWFQHYLSHVNPGAKPPPADVRVFIDELNESGRAVIGTPDMAIAQLQRLQESSGGFGAYLFLGADLAPWSAQLRSYELFAEEVLPEMNGRIDRPRAQHERLSASGTTTADATAQAQADARADFDRRKRGASRV